MPAMVRLLLFLAFVATDVFGFGGRSNHDPARNSGSHYSSSRSWGHQPYSGPTSSGGGYGQRPQTYGRGGYGGMGSYRLQPTNPYPIGPQTTAPPGTTAPPMTDEPTTTGPATTVTTTKPPSDDCPLGESVKLTVIDSEEIKDCYPSDLVDDCPGPTIVEPQKTLRGYAKEVVDAEDRRDCIQLCMETTEFDCLSGLFFLDDPEQNCVLNDANQDTDPSLFIEEDLKSVDYFEPRCLTRNRLRARTRSRLRALGLRHRLQKLRAQARGRAQLRRFKLTERRIMSEIQTDIGTRKPFDGKLTLWSRCSASVSGNKYKYKRCKNNDIRKCRKVKGRCPRSRKTSNRRDSTFRRRMSALARLRALGTGRS